MAGGVDERNGRSRDLKIFIIIISKRGGEGDEGGQKALTRSIIVQNTEYLVLYMIIENTNSSTQTLELSPTQPQLVFYCFSLTGKP